MCNLNLDMSHVKLFLPAKELQIKNKEAADICRSIIENSDEDLGMKGWLTPGCDQQVMDKMRLRAEEIRKNADIFVIVGVGGSNQAARAVIKALQNKDGSPRIIYAGNTLSSHYISNIIEEIKDKNVYINVIAKNFATLEPGSHFRVLRKVMEKRYSQEEMAQRIIVTGSIGSRLDEIAREKGYLFLPFPDDIGGRYSAFSPVGLFPMMVAGLDIELLLKGANSMKNTIWENNQDNPAVSYAAYRNLAYENGFNIELLASFEPQLEYFTKWWIQLFGESEGKEGKGTFPAGVVYSEDLHSMGQYLQEGRRNLLETFIRVEKSPASVIVEPDRDFKDGFDYLDGMDFQKINKAAEQATFEAHIKGGVPCIGIKINTIDEEAFGQLFYFFMMACAISGKLLKVNPFDQEGVEEYKRSMFNALGAY
jgi:glucose-6-phosphate isomerase